MPESCIYEGRVDHRRSRPVEHAFGFPLFMMYLDLDELPGLFDGRWLWSARRRALARFDRRDHLGDPQRPLAEAVRDLVETERGLRPRGPVRLLTHLRYAGLVFNPVSLFYCFEPDGRTLSAVVADVHNTPWNERHAYVVVPGAGPQPKRFHVSPFMPMEQDYRWSLSAPGPALTLGIENHDAEGRLFSARLALERVEIRGRSLARVLCRYPVLTAQVLIGIYGQAWRLYRKGAPYHPHPGSGPEPDLEGVR